MAAPTFDRERAIRILLDAQDMGDATACKRHKITVRTLERYRRRLVDDPELSQAVALKKAEIEQGWRRERLAALRTGLRKLDELFAKASMKQLRDLVGGVKILGELQVASEVLSDDSDRPDRSDEEPAPPAGHPPGSEGPPVH